MRYVEKSAINGLVIEAQAILKAISGYNDSDRVKDIIRILYSGCCAFCGSSPEHSSFYQIEHFYPKGNATYSRYKKDIFNLHYGCQRCNTLKSTSVHLNIFSPNNYLKGNKWHHTAAKKIESELVYVGHILYSINNRPGSTDRAQQTINLFDLNNDINAGRSGRQHLVEQRIRVFDDVYHLLSAIYYLIAEQKITPSIDQSIRVLFMIIMRALSPRSAYSNMIVQNFGNDIVKLLTVFLKLRRISLTTTTATTGSI